MKMRDWLPQAHLFPFLQPSLAAPYYLFSHSALPTSTITTTEIRMTDYASQSTELMVWNKCAGYIRIRVEIHVLQLQFVIKKWVQVLVAEILKHVNEVLQMAPYCLLASSMRSTYLLDPIMSSRYSRNPSSCGVCALGFISEICSTSPCRVRVGISSLILYCRLSRARLSYRR